MMPDPDIAASVTGEGRRMILLIKTKSNTIYTNAQLNDKRFNRAQLLDKKASQSHHLVWVEGHEQTKDLLELHTNFPEINFHHVCTFPMKDFEDSIRRSDVLYGDTDSIMVLYRLLAQFNDIADSMTRINVVLGFMSCLGGLGAEYLTSLCRRPNNLVYEKAMWPYMLFTRKRYAYIKFLLGDHGGKGKRIVQGLGVKRADTFQLLVQMFDYLLDRMLTIQPMSLHIRQIPLLKSYVQNTVQRLFRQLIPIALLTISMTYQGTKKKLELPHAEVARKRQLRNPSDIAKAGERVNFAYAKAALDQIANKKGEYERPTKRMKKWKAAEDVDYMIANNIPYDPECYLDRMLHALTELCTWYFHPGGIRVAETEGVVNMEANMTGTSLVPALPSSTSSIPDKDRFAPSLQLREDIAPGSVWNGKEWLLQGVPANTPNVPTPMKIEDMSTSSSPWATLGKAASSTSKTKPTKRKRSRGPTRKEIAQWKATSTYRPELFEEVESFGKTANIKSTSLQAANTLRSRQITLGQVQELRSSASSSSDGVKPKVQMSLEEAYELTQRELFFTHIRRQVSERSVEAERNALGNTEQSDILSNIGFNVKQNITSFVQVRKRVRASAFLRRHMFDIYCCLRRVIKTWKRFKRDTVTQSSHPPAPNVEVPTTVVPMDTSSSLAPTIPATHRPTNASAAASFFTPRRRTIPTARTPVTPSPAEDFDATPPPLDYF